MVGTIRAHELRAKLAKEHCSDAELLKQVEEYRMELSTLRVAKVTGAAASKLSKIRIVRKSIARILTVYNERRKFRMRSEWAHKLKKPIDLRSKKTRALRRKIPSTNLTVKAKKKLLNFKLRKYAVQG
eukprot:TRINITY_DN61316_c0_g1_i1.p1 TRINITY_DN61316_c0_g1~~TRINITY_DN61316_c0_g1_i1.p1  ORF type:complete len:128 (+),score=16.94 TRINITY_DN61316_c0_g1_i1:69-452(+)